MTQTLIILSMEKQLTRSQKSTTWRGIYLSRANARVLLLILMLLATLPMLYAWLPLGDDWPTFFRPATLMLLRGQSPYSVGIGFYNPPWALLPLVPMALLPFQWGRLVLFFVSLAAFAYGARKLTSQPISILLFMTSTPVVFCLNGGNIDWLLMLAFVTPAPFALMLAAIKPQIGIGIAFYWLIESWRLGGIRLMIKNFTPVGLLLIASFLLYGFYPLSFGQLNHVIWNASPFPYLIPLGVFFLVSVLRSQEDNPLMAAGLFFSPYFSIHSLFTFLVPLLERPKVLFVAWTLLWIAVMAKAVIR